MSSLSVVNPKITILDHSINIVDGLYSLNDMHKAGGGATKHQPAFFLRNKEINELAEEIKQSANLQSDHVIRKVNGGAKRGTYVCKELVYRYAMWISPKFALIVIRTFDQLMTGQPQNINQLTPTQTLPLRNAVNGLVTKAGIMYPDAYKMVHQRFNVNHIKELKPEQIKEAVEYVHSLILNIRSSPKFDIEYINKMVGMGSKKVDEINHAVKVAESYLTKLEETLEGLSCSIEVIKTHNATNHSLFESLRWQKPQLNN